MINKNRDFPVSQVVLIILDSAGIGELPDADEYDDSGADTLGNIADQVKGLNLPEMEKLGLGKIKKIKGLKADIEAEGAFGKMAEASTGKDTTTGHWELAGLITENPFPTYPEGFPSEVINKFTEEIGKDILGNKPASGTKIIEELGNEHLKTGKPIVYTSADSVFQIAAHKDIFPVEKLYQMCEKARNILQGEHGVARVIARPFIGTPGNFTRTAERRDFSIKPPAETMMDKIQKEGLKVKAVGKIVDIFAGQGISEYNHTLDNMKTVDGTLKYLKHRDKGLIFANLIEFDMKYGHRRDVEGYYQALKEFDQRIPEIKSLLNKDDILIITADHGCDPTYKGTDHTREYVPLLIYGERIKPNFLLETRNSFADLGATITDLLNVEQTKAGFSFADKIFFH